MNGLKTEQVKLISMGSKSPKLFKHSGRSKPRTTDRRSPRRRQTAKWGNRTPRVSGYSERSEPRTKDRHATDEG